MEGAIAREQMRLLNRVTVIPLILVCSLAVLLATFQHKIFQIDHFLKQTDQAIKEVRRTQRLLLIMESSYNSYVVTRRQEFLHQYQEARNEVPEAFSELEETVRKTGGKDQFIDLRKAFADWVVHSESLFGKTFAEGVSIFEGPKFQKKGHFYMNGLRNAFDDFINKQMIIRDKQLKRAEKVRENFLIYGILLMLAVAIFLAWFFRKELKSAFQKYEDQQRELEESRNELKKTLGLKDLALRSRDDFISIASHELNTPLQSLKLQVQMFKRDLAKTGSTILQPEKLGKFLDREDGQINRLSNLVEDMLEITRLGNGVLKINKEIVPLNQLIRDTLEGMSDAIEASGSTVRLELTEDLNGFWDSKRLEQILHNLISNALKYGQSSPITIKTVLDSAWAIIKVSDQGRGLPLEAQERIFQRFERNISASEVSGMGLGLFITRQLVEAHGGDIWVESSGDGLGSTFIVKLPLKMALLFSPSTNLQHKRRRLHHVPTIRDSISFGPLS